MNLRTNAEIIKQGYIDACEAVKARGGYVAPGASMQSLHTAITDIPHDQVLAYYISSNTLIPAKAEPYAKVNKIGGMSYKTRNLIPLPYRKGNVTITGVTFTVNDEGAVLVNGTATKDTYYGLYQGEPIIPLSIAHTYIANKDDNNASAANCEFLLQCYKDGKYAYGSHIQTRKTITISTEYEELRLFIYVPSGATVNNVTFKPMVNVGSTALPFEPYFKGLRETKVTELESIGANLIPFPYYYSGERTLNGVTWIFNEDGSISANGTQSSGSAVVISTFLSNIILNGTYTISVDKPLPSGVNIYLTASDGLGNIEFCKNGETQTTKVLENRISGSIRLWCRAGTVFDNVIFYPMFNKGSTAAPYKPYRKDVIDTLVIPEAICALEGYGKGVSADYHNYIDFEKKVFVQNVYQVVFDGTEGWAIKQGNTDEGDWFQVQLPYAPKTTGSENSALVNDYKYASIGTTTTTNGFCLLLSGWFRIRPDLTMYAAVDDWKAHLAELYASGNPLVLEYALATPIEIDISAYLNNNFIEVEEYGSLIPINEYNNDVPIELTYIINTVAGG